MPDIEVPCPTCSGTGNMTPGGGRNNLKDRCTTCGGRRTIPARPGESRETSWPFAVPEAAQARLAEEAARHSSIDVARTALEAVAAILSPIAETSGTAMAAFQVAEDALTELTHSKLPADV
ncbi:hypothetical protein [uncultured Methylobacterium sp.]|uniref:hypothetical protein n=1 Tax=uncultured Methylobacterium sp. TaxID=157278 RepID=UPI002596ADC7|nr:hypothetical protein [uncultured Methylobacterium sp.]